MDRRTAQAEAVTGLAALSLDAMASVASGPEAIVLVLAAAGGHGLCFTLPVTLAFAGLLAVLVASYRDFQKGMGASRIETNGVDADLVDLNGGEIARFLGAVGKDPDAYGAIVNAQQATTTDLMNGLADRYAEAGKKGDFAEVRNEVPRTPHRARSSRASSPRRARTRCTSRRRRLTREERMKLGDDAERVANDGYDDGRGRYRGYPPKPQSGGN